MRLASLIAIAITLAACTAPQPLQLVERQSQALWKETPNSPVVGGAADITAKPILIDANAHPTIALVVTYTSGKMQQFYFEVADALGFADSIRASAKALEQ